MHLNKKHNPINVIRWPNLMMIFILVFVAFSSFAFGAEVGEGAGEEKETMFFIVIDEAHYGTTKKSDFNVNFNTDEMSKKKNVILLLVTATPYSLVTSNSRIPETNRIDWFSEQENENIYYGIKDYIAAAEESDNQSSSGFLTWDKELEDMILEDRRETSKLANKHFPSIPKDKEKKSDAIWRILRLKNVSLQYMQSMLLKFLEMSKARREIAIKCSEIFQKFELTEKSAELFRRIIHINNEGEVLQTGSMCLLRVMYKEDGKFVYDILYKLRKMLEMENCFSLIMDCDETIKGRSGMGEFNKNEKPFLARLQKWSGNPDFRASQYVDLANLPIILIVVQKGKMGITYPRSLRCYDLRLRYFSTTMVTRTC